MKNNHYFLTIGWLYPDLMSTYGDKGNILVLTKRCEWRNIKVRVKKIDTTTSENELLECNKCTQWISDRGSA
jgi:CobQ-like glutamine amidotransferase family enzyme